MIVRTPLTRAIARQRHGFSLLEILVVVAIMMILAGVAGVYFFGYMEDSEIKAGRIQCRELENACKNYMAMTKEMPPNLETLVTPQNGGQPLVTGGDNALNSPFGTRYTLDATAVDEYNNPEPRVTFMDRKGNTYHSEFIKNKYKLPQ